MNSQNYCRDCKDFKSKDGHSSFCDKIECITLADSLDCGWFRTKLKQGEKDNAKKKGGE